MVPTSLNGLTHRAAHFLGSGNHIPVNPELPWYDAAAQEVDALKLAVLQWSFVVYVALLFALTTTWLPVRQLLVQQQGKLQAESSSPRDAIKATLMMGMAEEHTSTRLTTQSGYTTHFLGTCSRQGWLAFGACTPVMLTALVAHDFLSTHKANLLPTYSWVWLLLSISVFVVLHLPFTQLWFLKKCSLVQASYVLIEEGEIDDKSSHGSPALVTEQALLKVVSLPNSGASRCFLFGGDTYVWNDEAYRFLPAGDLGATPQLVNHDDTSSTLQVRDKVVVVTGFAVDDHPGSAFLQPEDKGEILKFNGDGDVYSMFANHGHQWIMEKDLLNLRRDIGSAGTEMKQSESPACALGTDNEAGDEMEPLLPHKKMLKEPVKTTGLGKMPASLDLVRPDGKVRKVLLTKPGAKICFGLPPPPGGWYGPFGFLRMVAYTFDAFVVVGVCCFLYSATLEGGFATFACALLVVAARFAAIAAQAHEGLANQVSEIAEQNAKFARKNKKLCDQVNELEGVEARITDASGKLEGDESRLTDILAGLNRVTNTMEVNTMLQAFVGALENAGSCDVWLRGEDELHDFWSSCKNILRKELPDFDLDEIHDLSLDSGLSLSCVGLIISAVLRHCEGHPHNSDKATKGHRAACAFLSMTLFAMEPQSAQRLEAVKVALKDAIPQMPEYAPKGDLHDYLMGLVHEAESAPKGPKVVPDASLKAFARAVTNIRPWPKAL